MPQTVRIRRITEEDIENLPSFPDDRDTIGKEFRLDLHKAVEAEYAEHKHDGGDPGFSCQLVSGPKGVGKTNFANLLAIPFRRAGYEVVSNISLLYGWHIETAVDIFAFSKVFTEGRCLILLDEIQSPLSRYRQANTGQMELIGGIAGLRKQRIHLLGATSQESEVAMNFLRECDWIYYPAHRKRYPQMGTGQQHYPSWCHVRVDAVGPKPIEGKTIGEQYGIGASRTRPKRKRVKGITPANVYQAAALQFSFASLPKGKSVGQHVMAKDMREALNELDVIDFDAEDDEDQPGEGGPTQEELQETRERDASLMGKLWLVMRQTRLAAETSLQPTYLMFHAGGAGWTLSQEETEALLARWTNHRPGREIKVDKIKELFEPK